MDATHWEDIWGARAVLLALLLGACTTTDAGPGADAAFGERRQPEAAGPTDAGERTDAGPQVDGSSEMAGGNGCGELLTFPRQVSSSTTYDCDGKAHTRLRFAVVNPAFTPFEIELAVDGQFRDRIAYGAEAGWQYRVLMVPAGTHTYTFSTAGNPAQTFQTAAVQGVNVSPTPATDGYVGFLGDFIPVEISGSWLIDDFHGKRDGQAAIHPPWLEAGQTASMTLDCTQTEHGRLSFFARVLQSDGAPVELAVDGTVRSTLVIPADGDWHLQTFDVPTGKHRYELTARAATDSPPSVILDAFRCEPAGPAQDAGSDASVTDGGTDNGSDAMAEDAAVGGDAAFAGVASSVWQRNIDNGTRDVAYAVEADESGNPVVAGWTYGSLAGPNAGKTDAFVRKLGHATGSALWTRQPGTGEADQASGVAIDGSGDVLVVGSTSGDMDGNGPDTKIGAADTFVIKLSGVDGTTLWTRQLGGKAVERGQRVSVDGSGDVFVTGWAQPEIGDTSLLETAFVRKLAGADGQVIWTKTWGTSNKERATSVSADGFGRVLVSGYSESDRTASGGDEWGMYVSQLASSDGHVLWTVQTATSMDDYSAFVSVDGNGDVFVAGESYADLDGSGPGPNTGVQDVFVRKLSGTDGHELWTREFGTYQQDNANAVSTDGEGNVVVAGWVDGALSGTGAGGYDIFTRKLAGADGSTISTWQTGSILDDFGYGVDARGNDEIFVVGLLGGAGGVNGRAAVVVRIRG